MKKRLFLLAVLGLAAMWVGCKKDEPVKPSPPKKEAAQVSTPAAQSPVAQSPVSQSPVAGEIPMTALTLVKLKVPNMT
ncbi:MAG: hypothetical protein ACYC3X_25855 [Pirellulaceae bacterium]